ncbi:MAG: DUF3618 domain-containing protein [Actinomycetota bacterium]|nr:DUF3618 domain-containing protein [Actinomycetota bacterium]
MSSNDPDQIREEIERTRADLSSNVNTLADSVNPANVAKRQATKVKGAVSGVKSKVMGSSDTSSGSGSGQSVGDVVSNAPDQVRSRTAGNPLAAGLTAFGIGWLAGSLLPTSSAEQQAATKVKDTATPVISDAAKEVADHMKEPAQQAAASVKDTATDAAATVKDEGTSAAQDVKGQAKDAKDTVQQQGT